MSSELSTELMEPPSGVWESEGKQRQKERDSRGLSPYNYHRDLKYLEKMADQDPYRKKQRQESGHSKPYSLSPKPNNQNIYSASMCYVLCYRFIYSLF